MFDDSQRYKYNDKEFDMNAWRPHELYGTPGIVRVDATTTFDPVQNLFIGKPIFVSNDIPIANYKLRKKGVFNLFYNHKGLINDGGEIWHPQSNSLTKQNPRFYIYTMIDGRYQYIPFNANSTINDYILSGPETILNEVIVKGRKKR
ncbi:MAG: hypothetical protein IJ159_00775 [Prevotella sp.]|nr:hypothetical protein [Prevotella sp.]